MAPTKVCAGNDVRHIADSDIFESTQTRHKRIFAALGIPRIIASRIPRDNEPSAILRICHKRLYLRIRQRDKSGNDQQFHPFRHGQRIFRR